MNSPSDMLERLKRNPRIVLILLGVLFTGLFVNGLRVLKEKNDCLFCPTSRSDFEDYWRASRLLAEGKDPYQIKKFEDVRKAGQDIKVEELTPEKLRAVLQAGRGYGTYLYPPFTAFILRSISWMGYIPAAAVFQALSLSALVLFVFILYRRTGDRGSADSFADLGVSAFALALLTGILFLYNFHMGNIGNGNIGFFLILLCGAGLVLAWDERPGLQYLGGVLLGLAVIIKVTPAYFGLILIVGFRLRAIVGMGAGTLFGFLLPALGLGFGVNIELFQSWYALIIKNFGEFAIVRPWPNNQTISGAVGKLYKLYLADKVPIIAPGMTVPSAIPREELLALTRYVRLSNSVLYFVGISVSLFAATRRGAHRESGRFFQAPILPYVMALVMLVSLVASGVSWYHAYSILFIPVFLRAYQYFRYNAVLGRTDRMVAIVLAGFGLGLMVAPGAARKALALYSVFTWLCVGLVFVVAWKTLRMSLDARALAPYAEAGKGGD